MRNIQFILERWGEWSRQRLGRSYPSERDAICINRCVNKLKNCHLEEYELLHEHYVKGVSKRALGRKMQLSEGMVRIKFKMAEGFVEGCLVMQDEQLEMESELFVF